MKLSWDLGVGIKGEMVGEKGRFQKGGSQRDGARITSDGPIFSFGLQHVPISFLGTECRLPFFFFLFFNHEIAALKKTEASVCLLTTHRHCFI